MRLAVFVPFLILIASCTQPDSSKEKAPEGLSVAANTQGIYKAYIELKENLVLGNTKDAGAKANVLGDSLKSLSRSGVNTDTLQNFCEHIKVTNNISQQREAFAQLSAKIIALAKKGKLGTGNFFVMHCPMAFNNKGADWISDNKEIRNPYFGNEMLECGEVKEEIK